MAVIRATENEFRSQVISWLNRFFEQGGYPFELATGDPSISDAEGQGFPDVQLWINRQAGEGFCGWELKPPKIKADDKTLIDNAIEKADRMNARYFVTWNMRDAIIWEVVDAKDKKAQRIFSYPALKVSSVEDLKNPSQRNILEERAREILNDLTRLYREGHLTYIGTDDWFFIHRLTEATKKLQPFFSQRLLELVSKNADFRKEIQEWAVKQGFYINDQREFFDTISLQIVYQLLGRLLFFKVLRCSYSSLGPINLRNLSEAKANEELRREFAEAKAIDYQAVFEEDLPDKIPVPKPALEILAELIEDLNRRDFAHLPHEVLGNIFENLIPPQERHRLGQYFTNEDLVDFITAFCVKKADDCILDPTCGTGTFLIRAYNRLKWQFQQRDHQKLLSQIWGIDIAPFPAELATINLYRQDISNIGNFPRILKKDFFLASEGQQYEFPPNKPFVDDPKRKIKEALPLFNAIVGNPPYIRQEDIDKVAKDYSKEVINPTIKKDIVFLAKQEIGKIGKDQPHLTLSRQADIYASMFVHAGALLKEEGRLGLVTSNSWLGADYGRELQKFFSQYFKIIAIIESRVEPWFTTAQVNTIFTILERCSDKKEREQNLVKFVSLKKKLKDLIPWNMEEEAQKRWYNLDVLVSKIENTGSDFIKFRKDGEVFIETPKLVNDFEDDNFRIWVIKQDVLIKELPRQFGEGHWGRFLRAPSVYFELRGILSDKLVNLNNQDIVNIKRGITTGITDFFVLGPERIKEFGIENEFLVPLITSFREIKKPLINPQDSQSHLFLCHLDKKELRRLGKKGALKYIEWGEKQTTTGRGTVGRQGIPYPEVPSVRSRPLWFDVGTHKQGDLLINRFVGERICFPANREKVFIGDTFFEVSFSDEKLKDTWAVLMNSTITYLIAEVHGRLTWAAGVLYLYGPEIKSLLLPDARKISEDYRKKILAAFTPLLKRSVKKIGEEVRQKDRRKFDSLVLEAIGIDPKKYLDKIYNSLVALVEARVRLGKMQVIDKKKRRVADTAKIKEEVQKEVLPDGLLPFPEAFLKPRISCREITVPTGKLKLSSYFMGKQEIVNEQGEKYEAPSKDEADFIVFAQKPDTHIIKIPKVNNDVHNAVVKYKRYIREEVREKLMQAFVNRTGDAATSERLTSEILEELGVLF